jgi:hypothetical protein
MISSAPTVHVESTRVQVQMRVTSAELVYERAPGDLFAVGILGGECFGCHGGCAGGWVRFGRDDADSAFSEQFEAHVAAAFGPLVVLFGQDRADQSDQGRPAGKMPTTSVRRRISLLSRSWGLLDQI